MADRSGGIRLRLYIEGQLVDDEIARSEAESEAIGLKQFALVEEADREGRVYLVEMYDDTDTDLPEDRRYIRWGTDVAGMRQPTVTTADGLLQAGEKWAEGTHGEEAV